MPVIPPPTTLPQNFPSLTADEFLRKSGDSGNSGRMSILDGATGIPELIVAKRTFKDRVLSCLARIPEFRDMNMVKSYVRKTTISNQIALGKFFTALATCYSEKSSLRAFEEILLKKESVILDQCTVRQLNATAEKYHGLGEAKFHSRQVVLNIWDYTSMDHCGHASLTLNNHDTGKTMHSSWWPARDAAKAEGKDPTDSALRARLFEKRPANNVASYEIDQRFELKESTSEKLQRGIEAREIIEKRISDGTWKMDRTAYAHDPKQLAKLRSEMEKSNAMAVDAEDYKTWSAHHNTAVDLMLLLDSKYSPRAVQTRNSEGNWGVVAQKIYFPMAGRTMLTDNAGQQKSVFLMFGLCEKSTFTEVRNVVANLEAYAEISNVLDYQKNPEAQNARMELQAGTLKYISDSEMKIKHLEDKSAEQKYSLEKLEEIDHEGEATPEQRRQVIKNSIVEIETEIDELKSNVIQNKDLLEKIEEKNSPDYAKKLMSQAEKNVGKEIGYTFASDDSNCASMAIRILRAGGAENFVKFSTMTTFGISMIKPDEHFSNYAVDVQGEIDKWNQRAADILSSLERLAPLSADTTELPPEWKNIGSDDEILWQPVMETVSRNLPTAFDDMSTLTQKIKNLVVASETLVSQPAASKLSADNARGMAVLQTAFNMHKASITALTFDNDASSSDQDIP